MNRVVVGALLIVSAAIAVVLLGHYGAFGGSHTSGSGVAAVQARHVPAFGSVELAGSNIVSIHVGSPRSVVVHADRNLLDRVTTRVQDGRLVIADRPGSFTNASPMSVVVSTPTLSTLSLTGSGIMSASGIEAPHVTVTLSGSGVVNASGTTGHLDVSVSGSGDAQVQALVARKVHARIGGSGTILVTATDSLLATIPGSGSIIYSGHPYRVTTNVTGSGAVVGAET